MKVLYITKDGQDTLLFEDVKISRGRKIEAKQFGEFAPISSQQAYLLYTSKPLKIEKKGEKYYVLDGDKKIWIDPLEWQSCKSKDYPDNMFCITILKGVNEPAV